MDSDDGGPGGEVEKLAAGARRGDRSALERLLALDYERLHAVCWRVLRDDDSALDATQEAVISIASHIRDFDGRSRYSTWSYRIAANAALDEIRRSRRRPIVGLFDEGPSGAGEREAGGGGRGGRRGLGAGSGSFEAQVSDAVSLREALERLPEDQRVALRLRHDLDLDYAEIAAVLRVPIGTIRSRIARGRSALLKALGDGEDDDLATGGRERNRPESTGVEREET